MNNKNYKLDKNYFYVECKIKVFRRNTYPKFILERIFYSYIFSITDEL